MKQLSFFITVTFLTIHSFGQFADTSALNNYIRDTIKDRRPDRVTAAQLQKALLGTTKFLKVAPNFSNSDLLFSGNRTHNGNQKTLLLNNFSSIRWKANNIDSTMGAECSLNSTGDMFNIGKTSYNSFQSNASGDPYWYLDTRDPSTNHAGLMYASPMTVQLASTGSALANSIIAMYNDSLFLAATDGEVHGDSILQGYSKIAGNSNYRLVAAVRDGNLKFINNEDHIGLDTAYRSIEQKDITSLSLLRRTSFNQNRSGFTFTSSGSSNPNLLFYAENLPATTDTTTYKPLGYNPANGQFVKFNGWSDVVNGGSFWNVSGNAGTNPSSNFIGTTDAKDLAIKTDNTLRAFFTYDGRFKVGNESFKNAGRQAVFIDSVNAANVLSIENPQAGFSSDEVLSLFQNFNNYADIVKYNSSYADNYLNTSIPFAGSLSIGVRYNGADYGAPIVASGSSLITIPSTTGTDFGIKADKFGLRVDKINALHTSNGPRTLYVNGSIGANKDSVTRQTVTGARHMLVMDTTSGKFERMPISTVTGAVTFEQALINGNTLASDRSINISNRIFDIRSGASRPLLYLDPGGDYFIGDAFGVRRGCGIAISDLTSVGSGYVQIGRPFSSGGTNYIQINELNKDLDYWVNGESIFHIFSNGKLQLPKYGIGTFTGTPAYNLAVDESGNMIEVPTSGGGTSIGSTITGGSAGSILYVDGSGNLGENNSKFFWDNTNEFLGIGTGAPSSPLHVKDMLTGSDATITTYINPIWNTTGSPTAFKINPLVIDAGGASLLADFQFSGSSKFSVRHDGHVGIGTTTYPSKVNINATTTEDYLTLTTPGNFGGDPVDVKYSIKPINGLYGTDPFSRGGLQFKNESTFGGDTTNGVFSFDGYVGIGLTNPSTYLEVPGSTTGGSVKVGTMYIQNKASNYGVFSTNSIWGGTDYRYTTNAAASLFGFENGTFNVKLAASGTSNFAVPFKRYLRIDSVLQVIGDVDSVKSGYALRVDQSNGRILLGDVAGISNGVRVKMDNSDQEITFSKYGTTKFTFKTSDGGARFDTYGSGTHTGTAATVPYFDAAGNIIEQPLPQYFTQTSTVSVSGTNDETTLVGSGVGSLTIPSSAWRVGKTYRVTISGRYTTSTTNPMALHARLKLGSVVIAEKNTFVGSNQDEQWRVVVEFTCRSTGSSGTIMTFGNLWNQNSVNEFSNGGSTSTINMTTNQTLNVTGILNDDSPGNSISASMILLEEVN